MIHHVKLYFLTLSFCLGMAFCANAAPLLQGQLLFVDVTVIDVRNGKAIPHRNVLIDGQKILAIGDTTSHYQAAHQVNGRGKYLIPGLWDMHTHNWWQIHFSNFYIGNGVLGVRNMYTPMSMITPLKDSIRKGLIKGPYYVAAGRVLEGPQPEFPDWLVLDSVSKIKPALDTLAMEGSDFVKVYSKIPREVFFELMKEVKRRGLRAEGHLPMAVTAIEASNAGQRSFEHLLGIPDLCTDHELFNNKHKFNWFGAVMGEDDYGSMIIDPMIAKKNFAVLRKNNTYVCPTLVVWNSYLHPDIAFEKDPKLTKFPTDMLDYWSSSLDTYRKKDNAYKAMAGKKYETLKAVTKLLYENGVPMLTGTDAMNPYCYPGYSLHKEFELLKECGIPDRAILKMATINAAEFLEIAGKYGEVKAGKVASLVLLNANPLEDIRNTQQIEAVVLEGQLIGKSELNQMLNP